MPALTAEDLGHVATNTSHENRKIRHFEECKPRTYTKQAQKRPEFIEIASVMSLHVNFFRLIV
jgi:hypothetical protein